MLDHEKNSASDDSAIVKGLRSYWSERSTSYSAQNVEEMNNWKRDAWRDLILSYAPEKECLRILDIGTGPGFFAMNLALAGHKVTAVDLTREMLEYARTNADAYGADVNFIWNRGEKLPFLDNSFDLIVNRNVTWNLEFPEEAFQEWKRVLVPGGRIVYFDANWYLYLYDRELAKRKKEWYQKMREIYPDRMNHSNMSKKRVQDLEDIAGNLPMSKVNRTAWDRQFLTGIDWKIIKIMDDVGTRVQTQMEADFNKMNPLFMVCAEKPYERGEQIYEESCG